MPGGRVCVVCATVRNPSPMLHDYAKNALENQFDLGRLYFLLITEDYCEKEAMKKAITENGLNGEVFNEGDRNAWMKNVGIEQFSKLIPRRSHAETSFGFLWVLKHPEYDYVMLVDDDTRPTDDDFFGQHLANLNDHGACLELKSSTNWVNVLHASKERFALYPRGYPYSRMNEKYEHRQAQVRNVVLSQGLWTNIPDLDSVRILNGGNLQGLSSVRFRSDDYGPNFLVANNNCLTISSMNLAFRADISPYFYQLPMDDNQHRIGRFDDIWSGLILKKICDKANLQIITGHPLCEHRKAPRNIFADLIAEANGLEVNEHLGDIIDAIPLASSEPNELYHEIGLNLRDGNWSNMRNGDFLNYMGACMIDWTICCDQLS